MSKLILPHGGGELRPLLLEGEAAREETRQGGASEESADDQPGNRRPHHDGHRRVHAPGRFHGAGRLARLLRVLSHAQQERAVLADSHHAFRRRGLCEIDRGGRGSGAVGRRDRVHHGHHEDHREVRDRQGVRVQAGVPDQRPGASRRAEGDGAGRRQSGRPGEGGLRIVLPRNVQGHLSAAGRSSQGIRRARLEHRGRPAACAIRCTTPTPIWPGSRSKCATASTSINWWAS